MFKILGADGKEYGPVAVDQIKKWINEGRANQETMAQPAGETTWKPLGQCPEFADVLTASPPVVTPGPIAAPAAPGAVSGTDSGARARAREMVSGPAIGLMVTGGLGIATNAFSIIIHLIRTASPPPPPGLPPELAHLIQVMNGPVGTFACILGLGISVFVLFGALRMQKLASRGLALTTAIVAMVPCFSPCCVLGLPIGIWALVVLGKPEVQSQFH